MKVKELLELNQMIVDVSIEVRIDGSRLLDALKIGPAAGKLPRYPVMVPVDERHIDSNVTKQAAYIDKSINAWDDGRDYWQIKPDRIPKPWLDLDVYSWEVWPASSFGNPRRRTENIKNVSFHGQRINIVALPSGVSLEVKERTQQRQEEDDGQISIEDWNYEVMNI